MFEHDRTLDVVCKCSHFYLTFEIKGFTNLYQFWFIFKFFERNQKKLKSLEPKTEDFLNTHAYSCYDYLVVEVSKLIGW